MKTSQLIFAITLSILLMTSCSKEEPVYRISGTVTNVDGLPVAKLPMEVFEYDYSLLWDVFTLLINQYYSYDGSTTTIDKTGITDSNGYYEFTFTIQEVEDYEDFILFFNTPIGQLEAYCMDDYKFSDYRFENYELTFDIVIDDYSEGCR